MKRAILPIALAVSAATPGPAFAVSGGPIDTMPLGYYVCAVPGGTDGPALRHVPDADFEIRDSSSYLVDGQLGTYLLLGDEMTMTSGPFQGARFHRESSGLLKRLGPDGDEDRLSCSRGAPPSAERPDCPGDESDS